MSLVLDLDVPPPPDEASTPTASYALSRNASDAPDDWSRLGTIVVDLLLTADAAAGPGSRLLDRRVPPVVSHNINWFHTIERGYQEGSRGDLITVLETSQPTLIENEDLTGQADHYGRGFATLERAPAAAEQVRRK